jgi:uncharacterized membrane protein YqaE (UPF0057 family)
MVMLYVVALFFPPLAILLAGKPFQAIFNFVLCCVSVGLMAIGIGFLIHIAPIVWAFAAVHAKNADNRNEKLARLIAEKSHRDRGP